MTWRIAAFAAGLAVMWIAVASPLAHLDHHLLTAHMAQHLLLMLVAAPLDSLRSALACCAHGASACTLLAGGHPYGALLARSSRF